MRILSIDLGDKRTGLALGDTITRIASPLELLDIPIDRNQGLDLLTALARAVAAELGPHAGTIIMGLPLNADGSESPRATLTRGFADRLSALIRRPITLVDERRSTMAADARLARTGLTHKQKKLRRDAIAAAAILQAYLDALDQPSPEAPSQA